MLAVEPTPQPPDVLSVVVDWAQIAGVVIALIVGGLALWQAHSARTQAAQAKRQADSAEAAAAEAKRQADSAEIAARAAEDQVKVARLALVHAHRGEVRAVAKVLRQAGFSVLTSAHGVIDFLSRTDLPGDVGEQRWSTHSRATAFFSDATGEAMGVITEVPFHGAISGVFSAGHDLMAALQPIWLRRIDGVIPSTDPGVVNVVRLATDLQTALTTYHLGESAWLADPNGDRGVVQALIERLNGGTPTP